MQSPSESFLSRDSAQSQQEKEQSGNIGTGSGVMYDRQSQNVAEKKGFAPSQFAQGAARSGGADYQNEGNMGQQGGYSGFDTNNNRTEESRSAAASQATGGYKSNYASAAPSAGWTTASPAVGWGSNQASGTGQKWSSSQSESSSSPSLVQKAKEYLPGQATGQTGSKAEYNDKDDSNKSMLDKAKEYLPMMNSSHPTSSARQSNAGQVQEADDRSSHSESERNGARGYEESKPAVTSQTAAAYRPSFGSAAPSAGWSTASPSAGWGSSQAAGTTQSWSSNQSEGSSSPGRMQKVKEYLPGQATGQTESTTDYSTKDGSNQSLLDKAKEYLPGQATGQTTRQSGSTVNHSAEAGANEGLLDKAKEYLPGTNSSRSAASAGQSNAGQQRETQAASDISGNVYNSSRTESKPVVASQTTSCYKPGSVSAPSAGWSSPSAGWGSSQAAGTTQNWSSNQGSQNRSSNHSEGSSSPSLTQKAKEYLPGQDTSQSGSTVNHSAKAGANEGLLDKAKEYLPGTDSSRSAGSAWQSNAGQQQESDNRSDLLLGSKQGGTYTGNRDSETINSDSFSGGNNRVTELSQRNSGYSSGRDSPRVGDGRSADFNRNSGQQSDSQSGGVAEGQSTYSGHQNGNQSFGSAQERDYGNQTGNQSSGFTQGQGAQPFVKQSGNQAGSFTQGVGAYSYEPAGRLPSTTGIPPVFHPPSYLTSDTPSSKKTVITESSNEGYQPDSNQSGGYQSGSYTGARSNAIGNVHAKEALQPITEQYTGSPRKDTDGVNAKQALQPLTEVAAGDAYEQADQVHAKDALQPLTEVPAQEGKGIIESVMEYLPGHQQTGAVEQEQYGQQPGMFDRAKAYVPSLHSSSHQTEESPSNWQHTRYNANTENQSDEPHPSLLDKAKAYIPVLGSSTDFDPATEARPGQEGRLYQEYPEGQTGFEPENSPHESLLDKARAYMPAMGAPGTTNAGIDAETGASAGSPHKGLVEGIVEKAEELVGMAKEYLPHQLTGAETDSTATGGAYRGGAYTGSATTAGMYAREVDPVITGVRLSNRPLLGPNAQPTSYTTQDEAPHGILDKVKQLVGLAPADTTSEGHYADTPSSPFTVPQGINAGFMSSAAAVESRALDDDDDDVFVDASEELSGSFTTPDAGNSGYRQPIVAPVTGSTGQTYGSRQPYVNQTGPPMVDTSNHPDDTFGPVKVRDEHRQSTVDTRGPASFGDDDGEDEYEGKKGFRAKVKGKFGAKKEQHEEKKQVKADQQLEQKMQEKEIPKAQAVTTPAAAPEQGTKAPTAGSNLGPGGGGGMMGGVAGGSPADPHGNAQSPSKDDAGKPPAAAAKTDKPKTAHQAIKQNEHAGGANILMGSDAQRKAEAAPAKKSKGGFLGKLKKPFRKS